MSGMRSVSRAELERVEGGLWQYYAALGAYRLATSPVAQNYGSSIVGLGIGAAGKAYSKIKRWF